MAAVIEVFGPHTISLGGSVLGRGDNDDLFRIEIEYQYTDVFTNEGGTMPMQAIRTGAKATVSFSLVSIDRTLIETAIGAMDGGQTSTMAYPKVGSLSGGAEASVSSLLLTATGKTVNVHRCRLLAYQNADFGNKATRAIFRFEALPLPGTLDSAIFTTTGT